MVKSRQASSGDLRSLRFERPDLLNLGLEVLGFDELRARWPGGADGALHRTDFHQLFVISNGEGEAMVDFVNYPCTRGTVLHVHPGRVVRWPRPTGDAPLDAMVLVATAEFVAWSPTIDAALSRPFGSVAWALPDLPFRRVEAAIGELSIDYRETIAESAANTASIEMLRHLLTACLVRVVRHQSADPVSSGPVRETFHRFERELEVSFRSTRRAEDYAERVGYSLRTLNRVSQAVTGRQAKELINDRVVMEAKRLLAHTDTTASTIGRQLGFDEPTNFGKFFLAETGETPGAFRSRHRDDISQTR